MSTQAQYTLPVDKNGAESAAQTLGGPRQVFVQNPNAHAVLIRWTSGANARRVGPNESRRFDFPRGYEPATVFVAREGTGAADTSVYVEVVPWASLVADIGGGGDGAAVLANEDVTAARCFNMGAPAAAGATAVHAAHNDNGANVFPGPTTDPGATAPRNLTVTFSAGWAGGDVTVTGTNAFGAAVSETFASTPGSAVVGVEIFASITEISKTVVGAGAGTASVGIGDKIGITDAVTIDPAGAVSGVEDGFGLVGTGITPITIDAARRAFTPTGLVPDGISTVIAVLPIIHDHS